MRNYTITEFDSTKGTIMVEYESGIKMLLPLPINGAGEALTGDDLSEYILKIEPKEKVLITNKEEIEKLVTPVQTQTKQPTKEDDWTAVRQVRNLLLSQTDYIVSVPDLDISADEKALWFEYRQKLRDITENENKIEWPSRPDGKPMPEHISSIFTRINNKNLKPKTKK